MIALTNIWSKVGKIKKPEEEATKKLIINRKNYAEKNKAYREAKEKSEQGSPWAYTADNISHLNMKNVTFQQNKIPSQMMQGTAFETMNMGNKWSDNSRKRDWSKVDGWGNKLDTDWAPPGHFQQNYFSGENRQSGFIAQNSTNQNMNMVNNIPNSTNGKFTPGWSTRLPNDTYGSGYQPQNQVQNPRVQNQTNGWGQNVPTSCVNTHVGVPGANFIPQSQPNQQFNQFQRKQDISLCDWGNDNAFTDPPSDCPFKYIVQMKNVLQTITQDDIRYYFQNHRPVAILIKNRGFVDVAFGTHEDAVQAMTASGKQLGNSWPILKLSSQSENSHNTWNVLTY